MHDHNQDNKFDDNDKALAPGTYDTHSSAYTYTAEKNKGGFLIPTYSPDIFDMFDFGDWLAAMIGILGKLPENLNKDNSNGFLYFCLYIRSVIIRKPCKLMQKSMGKSSKRL